MRYGVKITKDNLYFVLVLHMSKTTLDVWKHKLFSDRCWLRVVLDKKNSVLTGEDLKYTLTHYGQMTYVCVSELSHHLLSQGLVTWSAPNQYLHQCWIIVKWFSLSKYTKFFFSIKCIWQCSLQSINLFVQLLACSGMELRGCISAFQFHNDRVPGMSLAVCPVNCLFQHSGPEYLAK